jgi:hypothetical protein
VIDLDHYLQQAFNIDSFKIGNIRYAGVLKIGTAGMINRKFSNIHHPTAYTVTLETTPTLLSPAVPLFPPTRKTLNIKNSP